MRMPAERGPIFIELLQNEASNAVRNFLSRIDDGALDQTFFHNLDPGVALEGET